MLMYAPAVAGDAQSPRHTVEHATLPDSRAGQYLGRVDDAALGRRPRHGPRPQAAPGRNTSRIQCKMKCADASTGRQYFLHRLTWMLPASEIMAAMCSGVLPHPDSKLTSASRASSSCVDFGWAGGVGRGIVRVTMKNILSPAKLQLRLTRRHASARCSTARCSGASKLLSPMFKSAPASISTCTHNSMLVQYIVYWGGSAASGAGSRRPCVWIRPPTHPPTQEHKHPPTHPETGSARLPPSRRSRHRC